jgi:hypothetical protein
VTLNNQQIEHQLAELNPLTSVPTRHAGSAANPEAVAEYFLYVLEASCYLDGFPEDARVVYVPDSKQLVVEKDLPVPRCCAGQYAGSCIRSLYRGTSADLSIRAVLRSARTPTVCW